MGRLRTPRDFKEGVLITWGYWGVLLALAVGASLLFIAALYVQKARRGPDMRSAKYDVRPGGSEKPLRCLRNGNYFCALGRRWTDRLRHKVLGQPHPSVERGVCRFWSSRVSAHQEGCEHVPCYAVLSVWFRTA